MKRKKTHKCSICECKVSSVAFFKSIHIVLDRVLFDLLAKLSF